MKKNVGIFIFNDAEVLDFAGPFEVFSVTSQLHDHALFEVFTVAKSNTLVRAVNGLLVQPNYTFDNHPPIDLLIVAGGQGTRLLLDDTQTLDWLRATQQKADYTLSICSGARLLARLGLLHDRPFCTHHEVYEHLRALAPTAIPQPDKRYIRSSPRIYTSGGISAGIDLSFHVVETLYGRKIAEQTAHYMEYNMNAE